MSWPTFVLFADKVGLCDDRTCAVVKHLSNFRTLTPQTLSFMGMEFASIEHAFQGAKYLHTTRPELLSTFSINGVHGQLSGAKIKSAGGRAAMKSHGVELDLSAWDQHSLEYMKLLIRARTKVDRLYRDLIAGFAKHKTRIYHFERSGPKSYWGGFFPKDATRGDPNAWQGKNMLGKLLMEEGKRLLKNARTRRAKTVRARKTALARMRVLHSQGATRPAA